jgi:hypothetical protein
MVGERGVNLPNLGVCELDIESHTVDSKETGLGRWRWLATFESVQSLDKGPA